MSRVRLKAGRRHQPIAAALILTFLTTEFPVPAYALPTDLTVEHGDISVEQPDPNTLHLHLRGSEPAIASFRQFNIAAGEAVIEHFHDLSAASSILNRATGGIGSEIAGTLLSNGLVFLVNPAGIHLSSTANVQTAGFVASTLKLSNSDFLAKNYRFEQDPSRLPAAVVNDGRIGADPRGWVALLGAAVVNNGGIVAELGSVALAAGEKITLGFGPGGELAVAVDGPLSRVATGLDGKPLAAGVRQNGTISAPGGNVLIMAKALPGLFDAVLNQDGLVEAHSAISRGGRVELVGEGGTLEQNGTIRADGTDQVPYGGQMFLKGTRIVQRGTLTAEGVGAGDGGWIEVVSLEGTFFDGLVSARGGTEGGNGGLVEVSAEKGLVFRGKVDLEAPHGEGGTLLIDPKNITIAIGGTASIGSNNNFSQNPTSSVTFSPAGLVAALDSANVILRANNGITVSNTVDASGNSGNRNLTLRAGRGITLNADLILRGRLTATANDPGAQAANRDAGAAFFTMANGTTINTSNQNRNIVITMDTGPGAEGAASGDITLANLNAGTGDVELSNNGTTAGSRILRAGAASLITAGSASLDASASAGGSVGTSENPIRVTVTDLEAKANSGGVFLHSPTHAVNLGGAALGGLTGISTLSNGSIEVATASGSITASDAISANGTGSVTLSAGGPAGGITLNNKALSSGSGAVQLTAANGVTLSGANADTTTTGTTTVDADSDADGVGAYAQTATGSAVSTGAVQITAADLSLVGTINSGSANVTLRPSSAAATVGAGGTTQDFKISNTEVGRITTTGTLTIGSATNTGGISVGTAEAVNASSKNVTLLTGGSIAIGANNFTTTGNVTLTADSDGNGTGSITTGTGVVAGNLLTASAAQGIALNTHVTTLNATNSTSGSIAVTEANGINLSGVVNVGAVSITAADVNLVGTIDSGSSNVTLAPSTGSAIGLGTGAGSFHLTDAELDQISTTGVLTLGKSTAGAITVDDLTQGAKNITFLSGSSINDNDDLGPAIVTTGTLTLISGGPIGNLRGLAGLNTRVGTLAASVTGTGGLVLTNDGPLTISSVSTANGDAAVTAGGDITLGSVNVNGSGALTAGGSILDGNGPAVNLTATGPSSLGAGGVIGTVSDPIEVSVTGATLTVSAGSQSHGISAVLSGTVSPSNTLELSPVPPPGRVIFNDQPTFVLPLTPGTLNDFFNQISSSLFGPESQRRARAQAS